MWMYGTARDESSYGSLANRQVSYWMGRTIDAPKTPFADELTAYAKAG